ncbi:armadillo-type protein, partial [Baffinella frigidus]
VARALANVAFCHEENEAQIVYAGALTPLLSMLADCADTESEAQIVHTGALPPLLSRLADCQDTETRVEAVAALANLARSAIAQRRIVEEGGLGPLVSAIQEYPDEEIVKQVLRCLANLLLLPANTGLVAKMREDASSDAQRLSGMALANLAESKEMQGPDDRERLSGMALAKLAENKEMQGHMVAVGCLGPIDLLLRSGNEDMELQAARCLASLASHEENTPEENKPEIARSIGIPFFIKLAQNRTEKVQILAATCLGHLSTVGGLSASWG